MGVSDQWKVRGFLCEPGGCNTCADSNSVHFTIPTVPPGGGNSFFIVADQQFGGDADHMYSISAVSNEAFLVNEVAADHATALSAQHIASDSSSVVISGELSRRGEIDVYAFPKEYSGNVEFTILTAAANMVAGYVNKPSVTNPDPFGGISGTQKYSDAANGTLVTATAGGSFQYIAIASCLYATSDCTSSTGKYLLGIRFLG